MSLPDLVSFELHTVHCERVQEQEPNPSHLTHKHTHPPTHSLYCRRHREECEHRERVTTRSLEKVLGDLLSCKEDLHVTAGNNSDVQGRPAGASQVRRELRGGRDCTKALRTVLTEKESLQDAISTFHLREKASQLQIDTLQSTLHKSEFYKAKKWVKGKVALQDAPQEKPFGMYVYDMPKFNVDFFNSHETEYQTECKNQIGERHIHQLFENSPHRVMDGEVADLYFVPVYTGCYRSVMGRELQVLAVSSFWTLKLLTAMLASAHLAKFQFSSVTHSPFPWIDGCVQRNIQFYPRSHGCCQTAAVLGAEPRERPRVDVSVRLRCLP